MIDFNKTFESKQIRLRSLSPDDKNEFIKIAKDKDLWIYFTSDLSDSTILNSWKLNQPARKSLAGIGAKEEGMLSSHTLMTNNRRRDTIYHSIL